MKKYLLIIFAGPNITYADLPVFDDLKIQGAAAFSLSENAPTEISTPTGARQLGVSILGGASEASFGFETKPYWWSDHVIEQEYYYDYSFGFEAIQSSFSISGARYEFEDATGNDVAGISLGFAFDLIRGPVSTDAKAAIEKFETEFPTVLDPNNPLASTFATDTSRNSAKDIVSEIVKGRVGWNASFAAAGSYEFSDTDYNGGEFSKFGSWLVTSYTPDTKGNQISFIGLGRFISDQGRGRDDRYADVGGRIMWSLSKIPLTLSVEYIHRFADTTSDSSRMSALVEYEISSDMNLFISHGDNFSQSASNDEVFTAAGLSFGFGRQ